MECKNCGAQKKRGEVCPYCGTLSKEEEVQQTKENFKKTKDTKVKIETVDNDLQNSNKILKFLATGLLLFIMFVFLANSKTKQQGSTDNTNSTNNDTSYEYTEPSTFTPDYGNVTDINQMMVQGETTELQKQSNQQKGGYTYRYNDTFYFLSDNNLFQTTNFIDFNTFDSTGYQNVYVDDTYIYYQYLNVYYRIKTTELEAGVVEPKMLLSNVLQAITSNGTIYYIDIENYYTHKYNIDTKENTILYKRPVSKSFLYFDETNKYLYHVANTRALARVSLDGDEYRVYGIKSDNFIFDGDLAYNNYLNEWNVYSLESDTLIKVVRLDALDSIGWSARIADGFIFINNNREVKLKNDNGEERLLFQFDSTYSVSTIQLHGDKIYICLRREENKYWYIADYQGNYCLIDIDK